MLKGVCGPIRFYCSETIVLCVVLCQLPFVSSCFMYVGYVCLHILIWIVDKIASTQLNWVRACWQFNAASFRIFNWLALYIREWLWFVLAMHLGNSYFCICFVEFAIKGDFFYKFCTSKFDFLFFSTVWTFKIS